MSAKEAFAVGRWTRSDRSPDRPDRLIGYAERAVLKWTGLIVVWAFVNSVLSAHHLGLLGLATTAILIWYAVHRIRRNREPRVSEAADSAAPARVARVIPQDLKIAVALRDRGKCVQCGSKDALHFDHKIPWSQGGTNALNNIQLLCGPCNQRKGFEDIPA